MRDLFDVPVIQNNLRGLWVEWMVLELLGDDWRNAASDWAAWDLEHVDGLRVEVKQSALLQSWGPSLGPPKYSIAAAKGHYSDGQDYLPNPSGKRLADVYVFAWHEGDDQRCVEQWQFYVVCADKLPQMQKTIGRKAIQVLTEPVKSTELLREVTRSGR